MSRSKATWFRCFEEVPGIGYQSDPQRRGRLRQRDAVPDVKRFEFDGERTESLWWGNSSQSPAHELAMSDSRKETSQQARERALNALELPGELTDYHFAMQGTVDIIYKRRKSEPQFLAFAEWLAWFDALLVEAYPDSFRISAEKDEYLRIVSIDFLVELHQREGYLHEALALAERTGERYYEAELVRLKGELLLTQGQVDEAEASFQDAIEVARRQSAKSWELRSTTSLALLWQRQGQTGKARQLLSEVYGWFTEGFDTRDLQEAKQLLDELA